MSMTSATARRRGVDAFESGTLESWGGIVSGTVQDYAEAFGVPPTAVVQASVRPVRMPQMGKPSVSTRTAT